MNRKLMKQTVTISNKHLQEIFYRHNLPETAETSVTNETGLKNIGTSSISFPLNFIVSVVSVEDVQFFKPVSFFSLVSVVSGRLCL